MLTLEQRETIVQLILNDPTFRAFEAKHNTKFSFSISDEFARRVDLAKDLISIDELVKNFIYTWEQFLEHKSGTDTVLSFVKIISTEVKPSEVES